jgi:hypothetical protein
MLLIEKQIKSNTFNESEALKIRVQFTESISFTDFTTSFHWLPTLTKLIQSVTSQSILKDQLQYHPPIYNQFSHECNKKDKFRPIEGHEGPERSSGTTLLFL